MINLLGVTQICVDVMKMGCDIAGSEHESGDEISNGTKNMMIGTGWKEVFFEERVAAFLVSGWTL